MHPLRSTIRETGTWENCRDLTASAVGGLGEDLAARMLVRNGGRIIARNQRLAEGELDIVAVIDDIRTAVEVRSIRSVLPSTGSTVGPHLLDAFDVGKARQVRKVANAAGCRRVDLVAVRFQPAGVDLHWIPHMA